ncbi:MAG: hypothetical protein H0T45_13665, partial [Pyrinomonadaceae bacterium]|nr:hypothetical protein [Pyrinomonadaceae bacterium]
MPLLITDHFFERESPQHSTFLGVELMTGGGDAPVAEVLPAADSELVKEWDVVAALDGREQG